MSGEWHQATRGNKKITGYTRQNPQVICLEDELSEMGNKPGSQDNAQDKSSQGNCVSPVMFPSQESAKNDEMVNEAENEKVCFEVDDEETQEVDEKDHDTTSAIDDNNEHKSSTKTTKDKGRLSLGKKRSYSTEGDDGVGDDQAGYNKAKQRRLVKTEDKERSEDDNMQAQVSSPSKSPGVVPPITLKRLFCHHKVCRTLQEADQMNLYFAPAGVDRSQYSKIIVRKFENYRQRLRLLQSQLRVSLPLSDPIGPAVPEPTIPEPLAPVTRPALRTRRPSVLMKNAKNGKRRTADKNEVEKKKEEPVDNPQNREESMSPAKVNKDVDSKETSDSKETKSPGRPVSAAGTSNDAIPSKDDDDVVIETVHISPLAELRATAWRRQRPVESSPVKPSLHRRVERAVLDESSSDEDSSKFTFQSPDQTATTSKQEPTVSEQAPTESEEKSINSENRPVISEDDLITSVETPTTSEDKPKISVENAQSDAQNEAKEQHHECPMCFKMFHEDEIAHHAAGCEGQTTAERRPTRRSSLENQRKTTDTSNSNGTNGREKNDGNMSPVIKVRTPTKVRELRMLQASVPVWNLADEFSSKPGESFEMFGVNIVSSPPSKSGEGKKGRLGDSLKTTTTKSTMGEYGTGRGQPNVVRSEQVVEKSQKLERRSVGSREGPTKANYRKKLRRQSELEFARAGMESSAQFERTGNENNIQSGVETADRGNEAPSQSSSRRKSGQVVNKKRTGRRKPLDKSIFNEDFIPLNDEPEDLGTKNAISPTEVDKTSFSSSDDEIVPKNPDKVISDDSSALDFMTSAYKGTKRKTTVKSAQSKRLRRRVDPEDDESLEKCAFCQEYIPVDIYKQHVTEEIERQKAESSTTSTYLSNKPCITTQTRTNLRSKRSSSKQHGSGLPDFAPSTSIDDRPDSPLKTYTPISPSSGMDYYHQFSFTSESSDAKKDTKYGVKYGKKKSSHRKKKSSKY